MPARPAVPIFDLDGTLVDSDTALIAPLLALGVDVERLPPLGLLLEDVCAATGITVEDYAAHYDPTLVRPYDGISELLEALPRWAVCSHKVKVAGEDELRRFGWKPEVAFFAEDFEGRPKSLPAVLDALGLVPDEVVYLGDTSHDRAIAEEAGVRFAVPGWNPRARGLGGGPEVRHPLDVLDLL